MSAVTKKRYLYGRHLSAHDLATLMLVDDDDDDNHDAKHLRQFMREGATGEVFDSVWLHDENTGDLECLQKTLDRIKASMGVLTENERFGFFGTLGPKEVFLVPTRRDVVLSFPNSTLKHMKTTSSCPPPSSHTWAAYKYPQIPRIGVPISNRSLVRILFAALADSAGHRGVDAGQPCRVADPGRCLLPYLGAGAG